MRVFTLIFIGLIATQSLVAQGTKHGLIIAIGDYPDRGGWSKLSSKNDVPFIKQVLHRQGFLDGNIRNIINQEATAAGIETALDSLIIRAQKNDIVVIHISSHGEQIEDNNGDETDGLDEAIVCYDAISPRKSQNFGSDTMGYLRDDKFGYYIQKLRKKVGPLGDVVVFMDACHSGSGTRGRAVVRGGQPPLVSAGFKGPKSSKNDAGVFNENQQNIEPELGSYMVFAAARAEELDAETLNENNEAMGSLTYAISEAFESLDQGATYRTLFAKIQAIMYTKVRGQHPVLEGTGQDRILFGGNYIKQKPFFEIAKINNSKEVTLNAGNFAGITAGSKVLFYPAGTNDPANATAVDTGLVISSKGFTSLVQLSKGKLKTTSDYWAFMYAPNYAINPVVLEIMPANPAKKVQGFTTLEIAGLKQKLNGLNMVQYQGQADLLLCKGAAKDTLKMAGNGYVFATLKKDTSATELAKILERFAQYKFLESLKLNDSAFRVNIELIPIKNGKPDTGAMAAKMQLGTYRYAVGDTFTIRVSNPGKKAVFFNILDLQPDGIINPVFPNKYYKIYPTDLLLKPGESRIFPAKIRVSPPLGSEIFKVFISNKEINMEWLATAKANATDKGNLGVLETLVRKSYTAARDGSNLAVKSGSDGSVMDVVFEIAGVQ